jgi:hypothetical protein
MHIPPINWLAVIAAALSTMVVGFLWYSPILFAKPWMREMGYDPNDKAKTAEMQKSAGPAYGASLLAAIVTAFTLALFFALMHVDNLHHGLAVAFHAWLGFVATVQLTGVMFMRQSLRLYAINTGYQLVCYIAMGAILSTWR